METKEATILVKYHDDIEHIAEIKGGDWFDLRAAEDVTLDFMESAIISLGVSIQLPDGYEAHVVPRSSTFKKWGLSKLTAWESLIVVIAVMEIFGGCQCCVFARKVL